MSEIPKMDDCQLHITRLFAIGLDGVQTENSQITESFSEHVFGWLLEK